MTTDTDTTGKPAAETPVSPVAPLLLDHFIDIPEATRPGAQPMTSTGFHDAERIVVGIDGSLASHAAVRWAIKHARPGDTVTLVHAWEASASMVDVALVDADDDSPSRSAGGHSRLTGMVLGSVSAHLSRHCPVPLVIVPGHAEAAHPEEPHEPEATTHRLCSAPCRHGFAAARPLSHCSWSVAELIWVPFQDGDSLRPMWMPRRTRGSRVCVQ